MKFKLELDDNPQGAYIISNHAYHSGPGLSRSSLAGLDECPAKWHYKMSHPDRKRKSVFDIGTAVHYLVLEGEKAFSDNTIVLDKASRNNNDFREADASYPDKCIILAKEEEMVRGMAESVRNHSGAMELFSEGQAEVSLYGELKGRLCKARADWISLEPRKLQDPYWQGLEIGPAIVDLKTTKSADPHKFMYSYRDFYFYQPSWYIEVAKTAGIDVSHFFFVAVEKEPPYICNPMVVSQASIDAGMCRQNHLLDIYRYYQIKDFYPSYSITAHELSLPDQQWGEVDIFQESEEAL